MLIDYRPLVSETYAQWVARFQIPAPDADPEDDPNTDGVSNLEAYARGIAPLGATDPDSGYQLHRTPTGLRIVLDLATKEVTVAAQTSPDLQTWNPGPAPTVTSPVTIWDIAAPEGAKERAGRPQDLADLDDIRRAGSGDRWKS